MVFGKFERHRQFGPLGLTYLQAMKSKLASSRAKARWRKRKTGGGAAFTLIELLVVIAIIAILAAMPVASA